MRMLRGVGAAALAVGVLLVAAGTAAAGNGGVGEPRTPNVDVKVKTPPKEWLKPAGPGLRAAIAPALAASQPVGTVRPWVAVDYTTNTPYLTNFTLKGVGDHVEVWVQNNQNYPAGDCRNDDASRLLITQTQVDYFVHEFDTKIYPVESQVFSVPPSHDGSQALLGGGPFNFSGDGNKIVVLVMNIRDESFHDLNNANGFSYIVGVHHGIVSDYADRNIITVDSYDWVHRTGSNPPNNPVPGNGCLSAPAKPFLIESTFAHEYQHLLERWASPGESAWVNEGISDYAMELTGYSKPWLPPGDVSAETHITCFEGYLGKSLGGVPLGGPENSLTLWEDQGSGESLCDYGAVWSFMQFMAGRYGVGFMTALHNEDRNGLDGLQATLDAFLVGKSAQTVIHEWAAMMALDNVTDNTILLALARPGTYSAPKLGASINWDNDQAYSSPGAPPNGSDYVRLRNASGAYLKANQLSTLSFAGQRTLEPIPIEWTVDGGALYSGSGDEIDRSIVKQVTVGAGALSFRARWNLEEQWDFGFVQVSTDGGASYTSVTCADSRYDVVDEGYPTIKTSLPGFTGVQDWTTETCDLSAYAGKSVLLAFRDITDWGTEGNDGATFAPGFYVDDVALDGAAISDGSTLAGWQTPTQIKPVPVAWTVQLLGYTTGTKRIPAVLVTLPLRSDNTGWVGIEKNVQRLLGKDTDVVAAIVMYDDPSESARTNARYELRVNGVLQPGG